LPEDNSSGRRPEWPLASYLAAINAHRLVVVLVLVATLAGSVAFLQLRSAEYKATADLLVEPLPQDDETFLGLPLLRDTGDPARTVQTAAALVESSVSGSADNDQVEVNPKGESNILAVEAVAETPDEAAQLANDFANGAVEARNEQVARLGRDLVRQLDARIAATPEDDTVTRATLASRRDQVAAVAEGGDPTLILSREATPPTTAEGASSALIVVLALIAGFALGTGTALLFELIDRRVRTEEELMHFLPLPVLARVPLVSARTLRGPAGSVWYMPPEIREPYRTVVVQLEQSRRALGTIMVTSATTGDGKTTSAINLAVSLAAAGKRVIILDFDLRNPTVASELRIGVGRRLSELIDPSQDLRELLVRPTDLRTLSVLAVKYAADDATLNDSVGWRMPEFIEQAREMADHVIIDTPPLGEVSDALTLARLVDETLVVMRPGHTNRGHLQVLTELLDRAGHPPFGCIILGAQDRAARRYGGYGYGPGGAPDLVLRSGSGSDRLEAQPEPAESGRSSVGG
jgi:capsular exopolysaccharide synthesis family protein